MLRPAGSVVGSANVQQLARQANRHLPELRTHDRFGHRVDQVEFHPAYHELMRLDLRLRDAFASPGRNAAPGAHVARAALSYLWNQGENGICCPMGMTFAVDPGAAARSGDLGANGRRSSISPAYDRAPAPAQGEGRRHRRHGDDREAGRLRPARDDDHGAAGERPRAAPGAPYLITGHKWFFSVPMSDLFLTLAQTDKGLSCFLATGWLPGRQPQPAQAAAAQGQVRQQVERQQSEVEFYDLHAVMLGEEGRGIRTIIEMAHRTRLDFAIGSAGLMRAGARRRRSITPRTGAPSSARLVDLPIMRNVVADLAVESEAMMWMSLRLARALDRAEAERGRGAALAHRARRSPSTGPASARPHFVAEALECHGGNGFIADHLMERLYREAPLNGIWEGTGNVICLDVLRVDAARAGERATHLSGRVAAARGAERAARRLRRRLVERRLAEPGAARSRSRAASSR